MSAGRCAAGHCEEKRKKIATQERKGSQIDTASATMRKRKYFEQNLTYFAYEHALTIRVNHARCYIQNMYKQTNISYMCRTHYDCNMIRLSCGLWLATNSRAVMLNG